MNLKTNPNDFSIIYMNLYTFLCLCNFYNANYLLFIYLFIYLYFPRNDEKTAQDYKVTGGSVLHLVLALRGGN